MRALLLALVVEVTSPLMGQSINPLETPQSLAVKEFQQASDLRSTLESGMAPLFAEASERLLAANPGRGESVDRAMVNARVHYFDMILTLSATASLNFIDRLPVRLYGPVDDAALRAARLADGPEARLLAAEVPLDATFCLIKEASPDCGEVTARLQEIVARGGDDLEEYAALRIASFWGAIAMIQLSLDSGSPLALVERRFVEAEGLVWPSE